MRPNRGRISLLAAWLVFVPVISLAQDESGEDTDKLPPPSSWKPAGEVTGPAPTAGAGEASAVPGPMFSYGGFELDLKGRIQVMAGMVGDDAHTSNGDLLSRDGFRIRRARLGVAGQLIERWEYGLELDLIDEDSGGNALLDAFVTWRACERAWIQAGAGKLPFSRVVMVSSADMQFIERPVWVNAEAATGTAMLDPGRQVGITAGGQVGLFSYMAGVYNGSPGFSKGDLNDGLMYALRLGLGQGELGTSEADFQRGGLRWRVIVAPGV